jgi:hypothetical protein
MSASATTTPSASASAPQVFRHSAYPFGVLPDGTHIHDKVVQTHTIDDEDIKRVFYIHPSKYFTQDILDSATGFITKSGRRADFYGWNDKTNAYHNKEKIFVIIPVFKHENEFFHLANELAPSVERFKGEDRNICELCNKMIIKRRGSKEVKEFDSRFRCQMCLKDSTRELKTGWRTSKVGF